LRSEIDATSGTFGLFTPCSGDSTRGQHAAPTTLHVNPWNRSVVLPTGYHASELMCGSQGEVDTWEPIYIANLALLSHRGDTRLLTVAPTRPQA
jgi:hypothetical protein